MAISVANDKERVFTVSPWCFDVTKVYREVSPDIKNYAILKISLTRRTFDRLTITSDWALSFIFSRYVPLKYGMISRT